LSQLYRELDDFFDLTGSRWPSPFRTFGLLEGNWSPAVDLYDDKETVRVRAELPGLKKNDINVSVHGDTLILEGERKQEFEEKKENYHRIERTYGQFHRAITLPSPVNATAVKATYRDGILEVVLPKKEEAKPKQIEIEVSK
jgi:HSP20 family protein